MGPHVFLILKNIFEPDEYVSVGLSYDVLVAIVRIVTLAPGQAKNALSLLFRDERDYSSLFNKSPK
jgi:hypothetical protein